MSTICSILDAAAEGLGEKPLFVFPQTRWSAEETLTYSGLATRSAAVSRLLAETHSPGDRALLLFPTGASFWEAFMGCLSAGVIAVPLNIPNLNRPSEFLDEVCRDATPSLLLTDASTADLLRRRAEKHPRLSQLPVLTPEAWRSAPETMPSFRAAEGDLAFLQYTSGSTARPKGVQVSHANLIANLEMIRVQMDIRPAEDSGVTWLPHYHDMGLVGSYLTTLHTRNTTRCIPPEDFALRPSRWLELISAHKASICGGPDFAYRLCVEKVGEQELAFLDLASWRVAYIGSERIRSETLRRFTEKFLPCGFREAAFFPCYGLGEATLMATGGPADTPPVVRQVSAAALAAHRIEPPPVGEPGTSLVGCGQTFPGCQVVILDRESRHPLNEEEIGEVFLSGPSVTLGYYNRPDLNDSLFVELAVDGRSKRFLATGDLGFLLRNELFITGRVKELIIIRGRNLSPEDIEQQVGAAQLALLPGGAVAFSVDREGEESLVIVAELTRSGMKTESPDDVIAAIRSRVVETLGVNPAEILLLRPASIPRTSSGKLRRLVVRDRYLAGELEAIGDSR